MRKAFMTAKRRATQAVLQKVGKTEKLDDSDYLEEQANVLQLQPVVARTLKHAENYVAAIRACQLAARTLAEDFADFYSADVDTAGDAHDGVRTATRNFLTAIMSLDDTSEALMTDTMQDKVIDPLRHKLQDFANLRGISKRRATARLDYDAYVRNVRSMRAKGDKSEKLAAKERKLDASRLLLCELTADAYYEMGKINSQRPVMFLEEFRTVVDTVSKINKAAAAASETVGTIPAVPTPEIPEREDPSVYTPTDEAERMLRTRAQSVANMNRRNSSPAAGSASPKSPAAAAAPAPAAAASSSPTPAAASSTPAATAVPSASVTSAAPIAAEPPTAPAAAATEPATAAAAPGAEPAAEAAGGSDIYVAAFAFAPDGEGEIELTIGDKIDVHKKDEDGWWEGTNQRTSLRGIFPSAYVKKEE